MAYGPVKTTPQSEAKYAMAAQKKVNWRRKHEEFIQSIRSARTYTTMGNEGLSGVARYTPNTLALILCLHVMHMYCTCTYY